MNIVKTENYIVYVNNGEVTLAKSRTTGRFVKLAVAQAEYDLLAVEKTNSITVKTSMLDHVNLIVIVCFIISLLVALFAFFANDFLLCAYAIIMAIGCLVAEVQALECTRNCYGKGTICEIMCLTQCEVIKAWTLRK